MTMGTEQWMRRYHLVGSLSSFKSRRYVGLDGSHSGKYQSGEIRSRQSDRDPDCSGSCPLVWGDISGNRNITGGAIDPQISYSQNTGSLTDDEGNELLDFVGLTTTDAAAPQRCWWGDPVTTTAGNGLGRPQP